MGIPVTPSVPPYVPDFRPTHVVPRDGLPAWEAPDPGLPTVPLDAFLPVQLVERVGDWGQIVCSNGWSAWVDARLLVSVPVDPPDARQPLARTADPRPLLARVEESLGRYRRAAEELAAGRTDGDTFRRRTRGLRVGMVVDGESLWLYDAEHERWAYCDGIGLSTYATSAGPSAGTALPVGAVAGHEPTQVVARVEGRIEGPVAAGEGRAEAEGEKPAGPPPTQVAEGEKPAGPPPTQVVDGPPPTQVVDRAQLPGED
ncbi:hypothetical protein GPZ77_02750 [Streptomyces sp. QHH-9511]|uniref:hypothetical protein n=1 Tax=Streptomyces sp. QHH-9511 TaxID=2684468 RepID=UPI00131668D4|nr:hypothetical protein [Streptomyces sp. QHH-9511]QGZ47457.1 hypothetical protein GPZ77_02750 [Streptomyces sp. QHH-9511]